VGYLLNCGLSFFSDLVCIEDGLRMECLRELLNGEDLQTTASKPPTNLRHGISEQVKHEIA
jgi:hypothetical protein